MLVLDQGIADLWAKSGCPLY